MKAIHFRPFIGVIYIYIYVYIYIIAFTIPIPDQHEVFCSLCSVWFGSAEGSCDSAKLRTSRGVPSLPIDIQAPLAPIHFAKHFEAPVNSCKQPCLQSLSQCWPNPLPKREGILSPVRPCCRLLCFHLAYQDLEVLMNDVYFTIG